MSPLGKSAAARLAALMYQPGGLTADEAVRAATGKLDAIRPHAEDELSRSVRDILAVGADCLAATDQAVRIELLQRIYHISNTIVGGAGPFGFAGLGVVAYSLCELVDFLCSNNQWSAAALSVHLDSVRLMHETPKDSHEVALIQSALREMVGRIGKSA